MPSRISRRRFVQGTLAGAAAAATLGRPRLLRAADAVSANGKLNVAFIGTHNQASSDFDMIVASKKVNVVALCDVDDIFLDEAMEKPAAEGAKRFNDYREMLDKLDKEIDAVVVAVPDNHHYHAAMHAMNRGKHVYVEKPLCHDVWEARRLKEVVAEKKLVSQMGTQIHGSENYRRVVEKIRAGAIGKVLEAHCWVDGTYTAYPPIVPQPAVPKELHWDLWLGPAPESAYHPKKHPFWWRGWWDFGGGKLADMACHHTDLPKWALGLTAPTTIESHGPDPDPISGPAWQVVDYEYPAVGDRGPVKLTWYHGGGKRPPQFAEGKLPKWGDGTLFVGEKGMLLADYGRHVLLPEVDFKDYKYTGEPIPASVGHYNEWVQACLDNKPENCLCRFDYSGPLTEAVQLGVVSHRLGNKKLEWDADAFKVTNASDAMKFMKREYRKGWEI